MGDPVLVTGIDVTGVVELFFGPEVDAGPTEVVVYDDTVVEFCGALVGETGTMVKEVVVLYLEVTVEAVVSEEVALLLRVDDGPVVTGAAVVEFADLLEVVGSTEIDVEL